MSRRLTRGLIIVGFLWLQAASTLGQCGHWLDGDGLPGATYSGVVGSGAGRCTWWDPDGPGPRAEVLVVAGYFDVIGDTQAASMATWDGTTWEPLGPGRVYASTVGTHDGTLIAGGSDGAVKTWTGSAWQQFGEAANGPILAICSYQGQLIVGGRFNRIGSLEANGIAAWNGTAWEAMGGFGGPNNPMQQVEALLVFEGRLIAGGSFGNGTAGDGLSAWDGTSWQSLDPHQSLPSNIEVHALAVYGGELIAGGWMSFTGSPPPGVFHLAGDTWQPLGDSVGGIVYRLAVHDGRLIAAGNFSADPRIKNALASWDGSQWSALGAFGDNVLAGILGVFQDRLLVAFDDEGPGPQRIMTWDGANWGTIARGPSNTVYALAEHGNDLFAGGSFKAIGGAEIHAIARHDGTGWSPIGSGIGGTVRVAISHNGNLYAGGYLDLTGGRGYRVAVWTESAWQPMGTAAGSILALGVHNDRLVAGGAFTTLDGKAANHVACWKSGWQPFGAGVSGTVQALAVYDGQLVVGQTTTVAGQTDPPWIARWDGVTWQPLGGGLNGPVYALAVHEGRLCAGGNFTEADGEAANRLACWNGTSWQPLGGGMDGAVYALASRYGRLYAGGQFTAADGVAASNLARWDGETWEPLETGTDGRVWSIAGHGSELVIGGEFLRVGGGVSAFLARWQPATPRITRQPLAYTAARGQAVEFTVAAEDATTCQWRKNGANLADGIDVEGATTPTLLLKHVSPQAAGDYDVVVRNACGESVSTAAHLTVTAHVAADLDRDGDVDGEDMAAFISCGVAPDRPYAPTCALPPDESGIVRADFDGDRDVDLSDFAVIQRCLSGNMIPSDADCAY